LNKRIICLILASVLCAPAVTFAADTGGYAGISGGRAKAKDALSAAELDALYAADGISANSSVDNTATGWKLFGGYRLNQNLAVEGAYANLGEFSAESVITASPDGTGRVSQKFEARTWSLAATGILPLANNFELFGKGGFHYWDAKWGADINLSGLAESASEKSNGTDLSYGVGGGYNFTQNIGVRAEWEIYTNIGNTNTTGKTDVELWSLGVNFNF
jgi:OOP family OmpA-OmpF porin